MEYSITGAAEALGVSANTIRRRLANGLLNGQKVKGRWVILLPEHDKCQEQSSEKDQQATDAALVEMLQARVEAQEAQLTAKDLQIDQLHRLLARTALNATAGRPWWKFWG